MHFLGTRTQLFVRVSGQRKATLHSGLRQVGAHYMAPFGVEKEDIGLENAYSWDLSPEQSRTWRGPTPPSPSPQALDLYSAALRKNQ
jgi:hypothetical protein